jgi:branched-chain amino acid transport system permease protein
MSISTVAGVGTMPVSRNIGGWLPPVAIACALALLPMFLSSYMQDLVLKIFIYAIFALSLELLVGTTGLISLGHAAFFGIAAYVTVLASPATEPGQIMLLLPLGVLAAGLYALFVGALSLRTKGVYFIMVTLAFAQMAFFVFHDTPVGGGTDGIYLNLRPVLAVAGKVLVDLDNGRQLYYFTLAALVITYGLLALIQRSRFGRALVGIRTNEQRMRAAGYNTYAYKLAAFVIAGMLAGIAGCLSATKNGIVNPELLSWHESGAVLLMIILGGLGSLRGAVIGTLAFVLLKEFYSSEAIFGDFAQRWQLTVGLTMIFLVATLPDGLIGLGARLRGAAQRKTGARK